ncbi:hypothetical protein DER46DRAFT_630195 [Fusarium sp. MPI-SDFR-AT-0072]|nr:hypothetical protein DER46DRAFT_630195 [Fusarium sp. MPI-SDFR-AT-0072]
MASLSYLDFGQGDIPECLIPWHWIVSSTASSTLNSSNSEALYLSTPSSEYYTKDDIIGSGLAEARLDASNPSSATPLVGDTTPDGSENHHNSQKSPTDKIIANLSPPHLALESSKGTKPDTKDKQRRRTEPSGAKSDRYMKALERYRQAAAKCRARKQDQQGALTAKIEELQDRHQQLSSCCNDLKEKVFQLKSELLRHGDCECALIQGYIASEALKSVDSLISNRSPSHSWSTTAQGYIRSLNQLDPTYNEVTKEYPEAAL